MKKILLLWMIFTIAALSQVQVYEIVYNGAGETDSIPVIKHVIYIESRSEAANFVLFDGLEVKGDHPTDTSGVDIDGYVTDTIDVSGKSQYIIEYVGNEDGRWMVGGVVFVNAIVEGVFFSGSFAAIFWMADHLGCRVDGTSGALRSPGLHVFAQLITDFLRKSQHLLYDSGVCLRHVLAFTRISTQVVEDGLL